MGTDSIGHDEPAQVLRGAQKSLQVGLLAAAVSTAVGSAIGATAGQGFVEAARAVGARDRRIIFRHLLPHAIGPIIVKATFAVAGAIFAETGLSYLGLGISPPDTSLGSLVASGQSAVTTRPWLFWFPGLFIVVIVLSLSLVGDGLRDALAPAQHMRPARRRRRFARRATPTR